MRKFLLVALAAALVVPIAAANAESGFKVTGGGQALVSSQDARGPGDTFGFNAIATEVSSEDPALYVAKGRLNTIQRADTAPGDTRRGQGEHTLGIVTCLRAMSNEGNEDADGVARLGGYVRGEEDSDNPLLFTVDVTDNGEGNAADDDLIFFTTYRPNEDEDAENENPENPCDFEQEIAEDYTLARGNVQVHNYTAPE